LMCPTHSFMNFTHQAFRFITAKTSE
jgi:hypothetical protein